MDFLFYLIGYCFGLGVVSLLAAAGFCAASKPPDFKGLVFRVGIVVVGFQVLMTLGRNGKIGVLDILGTLITIFVVSALMGFFYRKSLGLDDDDEKPVSLNLSQKDIDKRE